MDYCLRSLRIPCVYVCTCICVCMHSPVIIELNFVSAFLFQYFIVDVYFIIIPIEDNKHCVVELFGYLAVRIATALKDACNEFFYVYMGIYFLILYYIVI